MKVSRHKKPPRTLVDKGEECLSRNHSCTRASKEVVRKHLSGQAQKSPFWKNELNQNRRRSRLTP